MVGKQRRTVKKLHKRRNILKGYSKKKPHYIQKKSRRKKTSYKRKRPNKRTRGKRRKFILSGGWNPTMAQKEELARKALNTYFGGFWHNGLGGVDAVVTNAEAIIRIEGEKELKKDGRTIFQDDNLNWTSAMQRAVVAVAESGRWSGKKRGRTDGEEEEEESGRRSGKKRARTDGEEEEESGRKENFDEDVRRELHGWEELENWRSYSEAKKAAEAAVAAAWGERGEELPEVSRAWGWAWDELPFGR